MNTTTASVSSFGSTTSKSIRNARKLRPQDAASIRWMAAQYTTSRASGRVRVDRTWSNARLAVLFQVVESHISEVLKGIHWPEVEPSRPASILCPLADK